MKFQKLVSSELDVYSQKVIYFRDQNDEVFKKSQFRLNDLPDFSKTKENVLLVFGFSGATTTLHAIVLHCFDLRLFVFVTSSAFSIFSVYNLLLVTTRQDSIDQVTSCVPLTVLTQKCHHLPLYPHT